MTSPKQPTKQPNPTSSTRQQPLAHSYIRFSSSAQMGGDSIARQTASAAAWSERNGIPLSNIVYRDLGISAFKKVDRPGLRQLTESIRAGVIRQGDYILLERLDRLSRKDLDIAQEEIKSILRMGVNIVAIEDNLELTPESVNDAQALIRIIILAENAHRQSREKSERIKAAYASARQKARQGKAVRRRLPCWLEVKEDVYTFHPVYLPIVQRIIELRHAGRGYSSIAKTLNAEGLPGRMGKSGSGTSKGWTGGSVREIVTSRALYGFYQPHITVEKERDDGTTKRVLQPDGDPIVDHYPPVIGYREWLSIQPDSHAATKNVPSGGYNKTDRLSGVARCGVCGGRVALRIYRRPSKKAEDVVNEYRHWVCVAGYASGTCSVTRAFPDLDLIIIKSIIHLEVDVATPAPSTCSNSAVDTIRATIDANKERAEQLQALLVDPEGGSVSFVYNALSTLQNRIKELERELEQLEKVEVDSGATTQADIDRLAGYVDDVELFNHELRKIVSAIRVRHFGKKGFRGVIEQVNGKRVGFVSTAPENPKRGHAKERIEFFARGLGIPEPGDVELFPWETEQDD
ncbi:recombinase family protein [Shewanella algae]|uniref:recombinase family protein n=1 Tax=Shewanella algae TaxID=38313 RepID=UPI001655E513|nr:recombinase family protein [Shewanella algae]MBC8797528.1 recombinase family protein [Shewanella algae]